MSTALKGLDKVNWLSRALLWPLRALRPLKDLNKPLKGLVNKALQGFKNLTGLNQTLEGLSKAFKGFGKALESLM